MGAAIIYYRGSSDFLPNPNPGEINGDNKSGTIAFLTVFLVILMIEIAFVGSDPFKRPFYSNPFLLGQVLFGFMLITFIYCFTSELHFL